MRETKTEEKSLVSPFSSFNNFFYFFPSLAFFGGELFLPPKRSHKAIAVESTKSIKIRMPEQSNDYRVVTFGSGGVGKSSLGKCSDGKKTFLPCCPPTQNDTRRSEETQKLLFFSRFLASQPVPRTEREFGKSLPD